MTSLSVTPEQTARPTIQVRLQNFRLFRDSDWFDLAPLTCLVGRNSSGKSSVVLALLLLKQSIENEVFGSDITPLALSGQYCDLGQFKDVVHDHNESSEISFSFRLPLSEIANFRPRAGNALVELPTPRSARQFNDSFRYYYPYEEKLPKSGTIEVRLTFSADQPFGPSLSRCEMTLSNIGTVKFVRTISGERKQHWRTYTDTPVFRSFSFRPSPRSFFPTILAREKSRSSVLAPIRRILFACRGFFVYLEDLLRRSEMIGPFRQPPERRYTFTGFGASRSGPSGEQAIDLLVTEALLRRRGNRPLINAVGYWLKVLKLVQSLRIRDIAKHLNLFEVDVRLVGGTVRTNLVDVGFGVSQVLPVLIQGLLMERGGIYFVQEPEIHLHPDAQAALADFFIYLSFQGITSVVETHSEYLLLRLRRRLAERAMSPRSAVPKLKDPRRRLAANDVSVLYSTITDREASLTRLEIGKGFQFDNIPAGFMSQITEDRMKLLEAVSKRDA